MEDNKNIEVSLPKGIKFMSSTADDVEAAYGKPTEKKGDDIYFSYYYKVGDERVIVLSFSGMRGNVLVNYTMRCWE